MKVERIKISDINQVENSRGNVGKGITSLMNSIQQHGLKQPIGVSYNGKGSYNIMYGNRRLNACMKLGWTSIPAVIETDIDDKGLLINNAIENIQRENVSPAEMGRVCEQLELKGLNISQIAARLDLSESTIKSLLSLYKEIPEETRKKVIFHKIGMKKNGNLSVDNVTKILNTRSKFGLSKANFQRLIKETENKGLSNSDLNLVGNLIQSGSSFTKALSQRKQYKVYRLDIPALKNDIEGLAKAKGISGITYLTKIVYGLESPIVKPNFIDFDKIHTIKRIK